MRSLIFAWMFLCPLCPRPSQAREQGSAEANPGKARGTQDLLHAQPAGSPLKERTSPDSAVAYYESATVHERRGEIGSELQVLRTAAQLDPTKFREELQKARASQEFFDSSAGDSGMLLDEVARSAGRRKARGPDLGWLLSLTSVVVIVFFMIALYSLLRKRYSSEMGQSYKSISLLARGFGRWRAPAVSNASPRTAAAPTAAPPTPTPATSRKKPERLHHGQTVANKYLLARFLGLDGTVEVWKAHDKTLDRPALVKRLYAGLESSEERARRLKEAQAAATLHHPNIVDLYEVLDLSNGVFVVYEYNSAKSVREILKTKGTLSLLQARDIIIPVCRALEHAHHRGITHGGLSPERIVLTPQGYVQVTDFVLARTTAAGSEPYAAPEAKRGEPTPVSDLYSLGMCFFEMMTGRLPAQSEEENGAGVEPAVAELLERTLDLDHRTRIPFARDFLETLRKLPGTAEPPQA